MSNISEETKKVLSFVIKASSYFDMTIEENRNKITRYKI